jgi:hypothetical protein
MAIKRNPSHFILRGAYYAKLILTDRNISRTSILSKFGTSSVEWRTCSYLKFSKVIMLTYSVNGFLQPSFTEPGTMFERLMADSGRRNMRYPKS